MSLWPNTNLYGSRLNGITFADLPYIVKGDRVDVIREEGKPWDSDARPAYSVRLGSMHVGYIPLIETIMMEKLRARDGFKKVFKTQFDDMTKEELRDHVRRIDEAGEKVELCDWVKISREQSREIFKRKDAECEAVINVRDQLDTEMQRNRKLSMPGILLPSYWEGNDTKMIKAGDVCSLSVFFDWIQ